MFSCVAKHFPESQAGGASTEQALSTAITSIQEALKSNDWATRKAASVALACIAKSGGSFLNSFKSSCILSLESCRFDKVSSILMIPILGLGSVQLVKPYILTSGSHSLCRLNRLGTL